MYMICEKCGRNSPLIDGEFLYYGDSMFFACKACAAKINDELTCARKVCATLDSKKERAETIITDKTEFEKLQQGIEMVSKKIPADSKLHSDIPFLASMVKNYISGDYSETPYKTIIAVTSALLYVVSPMDNIPDLIPGIGYTDDELVVTYCRKLFRNDLEKYSIWLNRIKPNQE